MAEEYVIRVTADESMQDRKNPVAIPGGSSESKPPATENGDPYVQSAKLVATGALMPAAKAITSTAVGTIGLATGNNKLQQQINVATSVVNKGFDVFHGAAAGFALAGPTGAIAAVASSAVIEATQIASVVIRHNIEYRNEQQKLGVMNERAGLTTNRRRR